MCIVVLGNHEKFVHKMEWFRDFPLKNVALLYFFKFPTLTYFVMIILVHLRSKCIPIFFMIFSDHPVTKNPIAYDLALLFISSICYQRNNLSGSNNQKRTSMKYQNDPPK